MMRFDPFREIEELQQRVDRMFGTNATSGRFAPLVDVHEDEGGLEISLDLPGIAPEGIKLEAENNTVTVSAERKYDNTQNRTAHRTERAYGTFVRTFNIPSRYDLAKIEATHQHGTLTLRIPRAEQAMRRAIPIKSTVSNQGRPQALEVSANEQHQ
ncbi:Hsp20/alpha crystallin family protein [Deinococcus yavapaiensis]|uniref:Heat shock protein Hsp20 n=1 Tax=Deinococcus yavapaiensis KR-236 TaxID=694435 RepID=A0A318SEX5_9DEIO|nr:Hsp20/alpha crystallin family protein [Deinococcus yavapaiensis]PYE56347.1 heat shock protein Hsp20 [Deinococcus yavapaiensis KR-236]